MGERRVWVIICAGGRSSRFGGRDKLNEDLGGRAVIRRSVELFTRRPEIAGIVVAGPRDDFEAFKLRHGDALGMLGCTLVPGGETHRWETVAAALDAVPADATHIAVHDAARPGTPDEVIDRMFEASEKRDAVIPAIEVIDTLKRVEASGEDPDADPLDAIFGDAGKADLGGRKVAETVDRSGLWRTQTPQLFKADLLRRAYEQDDLDSTDDAGLIERLGETVYVVEGDVRNIKITTPGDLELMRLVLKASPPAERPVHKRF